MEKSPQEIRTDALWADRMARETPEERRAREEREEAREARWAKALR